MKVVALLEVDENILTESGQGLSKEMERVEQSGIRLLNHKKIAGEGDYEYAAFVWNKSREEYEQVGRPVGSVMLAMNRYQAYAKNGWFCRDYDANKVVFKRRIVSEFYGRWEAIDDEK